MKWLLQTALATPRGQKGMGKVNIGSSHAIRMVPHSLERILIMQTVVRPSRARSTPSFRSFRTFSSTSFDSSSSSSVSNSNRVKLGGSATNGTVGFLGSNTSGDSGMIHHIDLNVRERVHSRGSAHQRQCGSSSGTKEGTVGMCRGYGAGLFSM